LHIPEWFIPEIEKSWRQREPELYGRFDLVFSSPKTPPKLLEYNADTPTSLLESSVVQYFWLQDQFPNGDQFNRLHTALLERWKNLAPDIGSATVHFCHVSEHLEDLGTTDYLRATAEQAGLQTSLLPIEAIGWDESLERFVDDQDFVIEHLFKLYPWEWMLDEPYGQLMKQSGLRVKEPAWKLLLSNKAILPLLWELFPNHPNLLPSYTTPEPLQGAYVKKPVFSREGANIEIREIRENGANIALCTDGPYNAQQAIYQALCPLPCFDGNYTVLGSWVVGGKAAGIGIREDESMITKNTSRFIPHCIV